MLQRKVETAFFSCEIIPGLTGDGSPPVHLHRPGERTSREGLVLRVQLSDGKSWVANVQRGEVPEQTCESVIAVGDRAVIAITGERASFVQPHISRYEIVRCTPVRVFLAIPDLQLVVLGDHTHLVAYNEHGLVWRSDRVAGDKLSLTSVEFDRLAGTGYDPIQDREVRFTIDARTGKVLQIEPPLHPAFRD